MAYPLRRGRCEEFIRYKTASPNRESLGTDVNHAWESKYPAERLTLGGVSICGPGRAVYQR